MELRYTFDAERFYLGTLCKHGHRWPGTNQSLRRNYKSPKGIIVNHCVACTGRKDSDWLISFIDAQSMGLPEGVKPGKPCKGRHLWNGLEMTLRNRHGKCEQCEKKRQSAPKTLERKKNWYQANIEEERRKSCERLATRLQDPEQRRIHNERTKACNARRRATHGRESRSKNGLPYKFIEQHGFSRRHAGLIAEMHAAGLEPDAIRQSLALRESLLKSTGSAPSVARLVLDEQRRYWQENPEAKREHDRWWDRVSWWLKYQTSPELRLYTRQKSKRRKAQMRDSVAIQVSGKEVMARFAEFGHRCAYCGADGDLHIEHVVPISKGGGHAIGNIVPACESCNYSKRDHDPEAWYRRQPFFSELRWRKICRVLGWQRSSVGQLALL